MRCVDGLGVVCDERFRVYRKEINGFERRSDIREGRLLKTSSLGSSLVELALYQNAASSSMSIVSVSAKKHRVKRRSNQLRCPQMNSGVVVELCRSIAEISADRKNRSKTVALLCSGRFCWRYHRIVDHNRVDARVVLNKPKPFAKS